MVTKADKNAKRINGAGAYLYIGNKSEYKFAQKNFKDKLHENPELRQAFINEVMIMLKEDLDSDTGIQEENDRAYDYSLSSDILSQINSVA